MPRNALLLSALIAMPASAAVDPASAVAVFAEAKEICARDGGKLWNHRLCGPMLIVDPNDRRLVANQADTGGALTLQGGAFTGTLPNDQVIANTPIEWSGVRWTELMWPLPADVEKRHVLLAHEMFHRIQPDLGLAHDDADNHHLDTLEGRYLLQLEWRALAAALTAKTPMARNAAVADALLFRAERYRLFPKAAETEALLESNEAIAEYTGVRLGLATPEARTRQALADLQGFVGAPTFVRSFAYATGPAYGLMLDVADPEWRGKIRNHRLDELLAQALHMPSPAFATLTARAAAYDDGALRRSEGARDKLRQAHLAELKARLVDGPVLVLPLRHINYQFNPQTLEPLESYGTVFPTTRITSDWGVIDVDGGALLNADKSMGYVSARGIDVAGARGVGWKLMLKPGWRIVPGKRPGDMTIAGN